MKYRKFLKKLFRQMIDDAFFLNLDETESSPENFEALLQILNGSSDEEEQPQLEKVLGLIREKIAEFEVAAETEEEMDTIHKIFQEAVAESAF